VSSRVTRCRAAHWAAASRLLPGAGRAPCAARRRRLTADRAHEGPGGRPAPGRRPGGDVKQQSERGQTARVRAPSTPAALQLFYSLQPSAWSWTGSSSACGGRSRPSSLVDEAHCITSGGPRLPAGVRQLRSWRGVSRARRSTPNANETPHGARESSPSCGLGTRWSSSARSTAEPRYRVRPRHRSPRAGGRRDQQAPGQAGIVYCIRRSEVDE